MLTRTRHPTQPTFGTILSVLSSPMPDAKGDDRDTDRDRVSAEQFFQVEMRAGRVIKAEPFPEARKPSYKLWIDFGELGTKSSCAQLTALYTTEELEGRTVVAVTNLPPRKIAGFPSEVLVLGFPGTTPDEVVLLVPDTAVEPGARVF